MIRDNYILNSKILFATPPFTQLNTPYPATAYLKGFLNTKGVDSNQVDLGIEVMLSLFSKQGLIRLFEELEGFEGEISDNVQRIFQLQSYYIETIDEVIAFLQNQNPTLAYQICERTFLPEAERFAQLDDMDWAFGKLGIRDKARHLSTLYLEDISDLIKETIDPHFGFSRYAEKLSVAMVTFDPIYEYLQMPNTLVAKIMVEILERHIQKYQPTVFCLSIPFPGNLFGALKCGQYLKANHPNIKIVLGGGYVNTELRSLQEPRVFEFADYICLDDGEANLWHLMEHLEGKRDIALLKRTFVLENKKVVYINNSFEKDIPHAEVGTPDYDGLPLKKYLSIIEIANPMHRLWSDGRWNKLTLAHGCYWGKCTFCDVSLDYIKNYQSTTVSILCDRIEAIIAQTGETGFHFVDEAAPPALLRDLAVEILRRGILISWWTNIRFEKRFTHDLCRLLKASGCIAISGGLEVASDRLLAMINKGVTVGQVAKVADNFTKAGIMVHSYLMYGFPTQRADETINALEMVRQLFLNEVILSGFWHRFSMTAHSPIGLDPATFKVNNVYKDKNLFANNDLIHDDPLGCDHGLFSEGLRKSLFNFMHGIGLDFPLQDWFDFKVPKTIISPTFIEDVIAYTEEDRFRPHAKVLWLGNLPELVEAEEGRSTLMFYNKSSDLPLNVETPIGEWLYDVFELLIPSEHKVITLKELKERFEAAGLKNFQGFIEEDVWQDLQKEGLLIL